MSSGSNTTSKNESEVLKQPKGFRKKFRQQKLPAWQPILTVRTVLPWFATIGVIFIVIGVVLYLAAENVREYVISYTDCKDYQMDVTCDSVISNEQNKTDFKIKNNRNCQCRLPLIIEPKLEGQVFIYYSLKNFYQNHRRYVKSRDDMQLRGKDVKDVTSDCIPYDMKDGKIISPCGAIANSLFNDTIALKFELTEDVHLIGKDIAWDTDKAVKFKNPTNNFTDTVLPFNWETRIPDMLENEDLIVWMRTAALPHFRKLYRKIDHKDKFSVGLPEGNYTLEITYNYPVKGFEGEKYVVLSTTSWIGGKNYFLGIAYLIVGSICILLSLVFLLIHLKVGKNLDLEAVDSRTPYAN